MDLQLFHNDPKYSDFIIHSTSYKQVDGHDIAADVLIPKSLVASLSTDESKKKKCPIILRFHGGGLFTGTSLYPPWFPPYLLQYASRHAVPIVSPNYRLLPECTGLDILADLSSFWDWLHHHEKGLQHFISTLYPSLTLNTNCILAEGESAGGYLVVQAALSHLPGLRAVIAAFPMLDLRAPHFTREYEKLMGGAPIPPEGVITDHLESMRKGDVVSSVVPPERLDLGTAVILQGRLVEFLGEEEVLFPMGRVRAWKGDEGKMPRLWIYHGRQDSGVPAEGSVKFVEEAEKVWADGEVRLDLPDGEHGVGGELDLDEPGAEWLREGVEWVVEPWLTGSDSIELV